MDDDPFIEKVAVQIQNIPETAWPIVSIDISRF
jgi:hypothetical protein